MNATAIDDKTLDLVISYITWVKLSNSSIEDVGLESYNAIYTLETLLNQAGITDEQIGKIAKAVR
jgi:hypothetical protein